MKIEVMGSKLVLLLDRQKARLEQKRAEATASARTHAKEHLASGDMDIECLRKQGLDAVIQMLDRHLHRVEAVRDVIDPSQKYTLRLNEYIRGFVETPFDDLRVPAETAPPEDDSQMLLFKVN